MKTIINAAAQRLVGIAQNPQREARLLAAHALHTVYEDIYFGEDSLLKDEEERRFNILLHRRLKHEPLSKIIEFREFWSLPFRVTADTLDPRPDSETLIEAVLAHYADKEQCLRILDLGTGTGCLLLSLINEYPNSWGVGVDYSEAATYIAQENALRLRLEDRAKFIVGEWGNPLSGCFDIIVSNPPYISHTELLPTEVAEYDPHLALYAGKDGLDSYRALAQQIPGLITLESKIFLEIGKGQTNSVRTIFSPYILLETKQDVARNNRCLVFCMETMPVARA